MQDGKKWIIELYRTIFYTYLFILIIVSAILNTQQFFQFQKYLSFIYFFLFIATVLSGTKNLLKI